jgi:hypothetical protein
MTKKGEIITRLLEEKEEYSFKSEEWLEKKEKSKRLSSKHVALTNRLMEVSV